jgi:hypothetical protein
MNISDKVRKSIPTAISILLRQIPIDLFFWRVHNVWFNVADFETIPSYFVEAYKAKYPNAKSIKVVNWGCPNYYSYQELMLFTNC